MWDVKNSPPALSRDLCLKDIPCIYLRNKFIIILVFFTTAYTLGQVFNYSFLFQTQQKFCACATTDTNPEWQKKKNLLEGKRSPGWKVEES